VNIVKDLKGKKCDEIYVTYIQLQLEQLDEQVEEMDAMPDPCPLPSMLKKRGLNEKERLLYAPMSDVGGLLYDKDAVYIDVPAWKVRVSHCFCPPCPPPPSILLLKSRGKLQERCYSVAPSLPFMRVLVTGKAPPPPAPSPPFRYQYDHLLKSPGIATANLVPLLFSPSR